MKNVSSHFGDVVFFDTFVLNVFFPNTILQYGLFGELDEDKSFAVVKKILINYCQYGSGDFYRKSGLFFFLITHFLLKEKMIDMYCYPL